MTKLHQLRNGTWIELASITAIIPGSREGVSPFVVVVHSSRHSNLFFDTIEGADRLRRHAREACE